MHAPVEAAERRWQRLRKSLDTYRPADAQEAACLKRMLALLDSEGDPFSRDRFAPGHFTASAFILSPDAKQLLLIFHGKLARWLQPGGHVEPGDPTIQQTALREVAEEVGLRQLRFLNEDPFDLDVHAIPSIQGDPEHFHFDVRYALQADSMAFSTGSDARNGRWMRLAEIDERSSDRSVMRAVEKLVSR